MFVYGPPWGDTADKRNQVLDSKVIESLTEMAKAAQRILDAAAELRAHAAQTDYYGDTSEMDMSLKHGRASFIGRGVAEVQRPIRDLLEAGLQASTYAAAYEVTQGE